LKCYGNHYLGFFDCDVRWKVKVWYSVLQYGWYFMH